MPSRIPLALVRPVLAGAILAAAAPLAAQGADAASAGVSLSVPDSIGDFALVHRHDYENPALGVLLRYERADSLRVDVFLYPGPDLAAECPLECARQALAEEVDGFVAAFPELLRRGYADSLAVAADSLLTASPDDRWRLGRHLTMRQLREGRRERSDYYLYYLPGASVKLRASYVEDSSSARAVAQLARDVVPALTRPAAAQGGGAGESHIVVSVTLGEPRSAVWARLVAALEKHGYTVADSSLAAGRIVTAPRAAPSLGGGDSATRAGASPGVALVLTLQPRGDSTHVEIMGVAGGAGGDGEAASRTSLELMAVVMLAAELEGVATDAQQDTSAARKDPSAAKDTSAAPKGAAP